MKKGLVFNIQRFSTHDGPGIRTTVFLKGCPLTCPWCSNPESQYGKPQLMTRDLKCTGCGKCAQVCPKEAVKFSHNGERIILWDRCTNCFRCVNACLYGALTQMGDFMIAEEVADEAEKDRVFYNNSGGGVTIGGGEPLTQHEFLAELLQLLEERGIHRTLDTTGYASEAVIKKIVPLIDLVLFDIKQLDPVLHKEYTGVENIIILQNLERVASRVRTWVRIPLIPGYNDSEDHIKRIAELAKDRKVEKVSLLPYHEGGVNKWTQIGRDFPKFFAESPEESHPERLMEIISQAGIEASVGS